MTTVKKVYDILTKTDGTKQGLVEQWVSVFGNVDHIGDRVMPGFFSKSLAEWKASGDPIPVIYSHQWERLGSFVGEVLDAEEMRAGDPRLPEAIRANGGLYTKYQLDMDEPDAAKLFKLLDRRLIKQASFAYDVVQERRAKDGANDLIEGKLLEVGPTFAGMNELTTTGAVKSEGKAAIASHSTATTDAPWDGPAMKARLGDDPASLKAANAWRDPQGDPTAKSSYKFIHHMVATDGSVGAANTTASSTGIGILNGGRTGTTIPDADRQGVYNHLARHLTDAGQSPPDLKAMSEIETKAGRRISAETASVLRQVVAAISALLDEETSSTSEGDGKAKAEDPPGNAKEPIRTPFELALEMEGVPLPG